MPSCRFGKNFYASACLPLANKAMNPNTDQEWEEWGRREPYFGVITDPRFRRDRLDELARAEFFQSGEVHADYVMQMVRMHIDPGFAPKTVLDYGCGVGRLLIPFAKRARKVVGVDVSTSMLAEAQANCSAAEICHVELRACDDQLSCLSEAFDLVHSFIVLQHIPADRGKRIFKRLLEAVSPGGIGAIHVLYSKQSYSSALGIAPERELAWKASLAPSSPGPDPEMQMNPYGATELLFMLQQKGVGRVHIEFTDHGGELGLFLFFRVPSAPSGLEGLP
jgi:SAM-dependent methyltransferase